jgi:hypothetical protein
MREEELDRLDKKFQRNTAISSIIIWILLSYLTIQGSLPPIISLSMIFITILMGSFAFYKYKNHTGGEYYKENTAS